MVCILYTSYHNSNCHERAQLTDSTVQVHFGIGEGESRGEREAQLVGGWRSESESLTKTEAKGENGGKGKGVTSGAEVERTRWRRDGVEGELEQEIEISRYDGRGGDSGGQVQRVEEDLNGLIASLARTSLSSRTPLHSSPA